MTEIGNSFVGPTVPTSEEATPQDFTSNRTVDTEEVVAAERSGLTESDGRAARRDLAVSLLRGPRDSRLGIRCNAADSISSALLQRREQHAFHCGRARSVTDFSNEPALADGRSAAFIQSAAENLLRSSFSVQIVCHSSRGNFRFADYTGDGPASLKCGPVRGYDVVRCMPEARLLGDTR